jgi:hypothetical protein
VCTVATRTELQHAADDHVPGEPDENWHVGTVRLQCSRRGQGPL